MPKRLPSCIAMSIGSLRDWIRRWTRPSTQPVLGYLLDRLRSPEYLVRENALLRKQLEVACRQIARPSRWARGQARPATLRRSAVSACCRGGGSIASSNGLCAGLAWLTVCRLSVHAPLAHLRRMKIALRSPRICRAASLFTEDQTLALAPLLDGDRTVEPTAARQHRVGQARTGRSPKHPSRRGWAARSPHEPIPHQSIRVYRFSPSRRSH